MKKSLLALAVSMVAASGAHAAWDAGSLANPFAGNGELLLTVWDSNLKVSVTQDTGLHFNDFQGFSSATYTYNTALDSSFATTFASSSAANLHYSLFVASSGANSTVDGSPVMAFSYNGPQSALSSGSTNIDSSVVGNALAFTNSTLAPNLNGVDHNYALNTAKVGSAAAGTYAGDDANYGFQLGLSMPVDVTALAGSALSFYSTEGTDINGITKALSTWKLNLATNTLSYGAAPAVPVPAAIWLMGSALAGLGSVARRRRV